MIMSNKRSACCLGVRLLISGADVGVPVGIGPVAAVGGGGAEIRTATTNTATITAAAATIHGSGRMLLAPVAP
jgi:hypothetical protein